MNSSKALYQGKCEVCGQPFTAKRKSAKYCNIVCAQRMWNKRHAEKYNLRVEIKQLRCELCDQLFWPSGFTPKTQKFCSTLCRNRAWRKNKGVRPNAKS